MNEAGVLGRFVPDFGTVVSMMQFNMYHSYTVDEHLIRTVGIVSEIERGESERAAIRSRIELIRASQAAAACSTSRRSCTTSPRAARRTIRSPAPASRARSVPRLGLDAEETDLVAWLIEHHLDMSTIAQSRDLSDPKTTRTSPTSSRRRSG